MLPARGSLSLLTARSVLWCFCVVRVVKTHCLVDTFAEDGENEDSCYRRREVAGDGLDVIEELATLGGLHDGDPGDAHPDEGQDENPAAGQRGREESSSRTKAQQENTLPASNHQLPLAGSFPDFGVDVHGEQRAGAVEDGG